MGEGGEESEGKFEFASVAWVAHARDYVRRTAAGANLAGVKMSFNEVFTDAPAHLEPDADGRIGWYLRVSGGSVEVERGILADADLRITADYATVLPLARMVFGDDAELRASAQERVGAAMAAGKMRTEGNPQAMADLPWAEGLHDELARHTL